MWTSTRSLLALALALGISADGAAAAGASVLVTGANLHEAAASAGRFSANGLTDLALSSLGFPTGQIVDASRPGGRAEPSPVQADLFARAGAYAVVLIEDAAAPRAIDSALTSDFHKVFATSGRSARVASDLASEFRASGYSESVYCVGNAQRCAEVTLTSGAVASVDGKTLDKVLAAHAFLDDDAPADAALALELAQVAKLSAELKASSTERALYVVALSSVDALEQSKQSAAQKAVAAQVVEFLSALQTAQPSAGAQVLAVKPQSVVAGGADAVSRRKLEEGTDENIDEEGDEEEEDPEEDELELEAVEDAGNKTANATSPISAQDIAEYQIALWTSVLLVAALVLAIVAMGTMDVGRDSLLYAKFTTSANNRKND